MYVDNKAVAARKLQNIKKMRDIFPICGNKMKWNENSVESNTKRKKKQCEVN